MLKDQPWVHYYKDLHHEWRHAVDEGKDVADLKEECDRIAKLDLDDTDIPSLANDMFERLAQAPVKSDFHFEEPSDLNGIQALRPSNRPVMLRPVNKDALRDRMQGAWLGRIAGCLLGKPIEGYHSPRLTTLLKGSNNYPLSRYISSEISDELKIEIDFFEGATWINKIDGKAPVDDDTNYTVLGLKIIERYGKDFTPDDVGEAWLSWVPVLSTCTAERVAYKNLCSGLLPPNSATYQNPFREWIGAQIRADFFGYVNPGNPALAADMAWRDASISHVKNGIYGEMFVAAMLAAAAVSDDMIEVIEAGLGEIPQNCRLTEKIKLVLRWFQDGVSAEDVVKNIHEMYDERTGHDWCHTISNAMVVVFGLLYGEKDFSKSICIAVQACFDTDCNGATVGSIVGMMIGAKKIPAQWTEPFNNLLLTTIEGYNLVEISKLAERTIELID